MNWVVYTLTTDLENYPTGIYRITGLFSNPKEAWEYVKDVGGDGVFMMEKPL